MSLLVAPRRAETPCALCNETPDVYVHVWHVVLCAQCFRSLAIQVPLEVAVRAGVVSPERPVTDSERHAQWRLVTEVWLQTSRLKFSPPVPPPPRPGAAALRRSEWGSLHRADGLCCTDARCLRDT